MTPETTTDQLTTKPLDDDTPHTYRPAAGENQPMIVRIYLDTQAATLQYRWVHPANARWTPGEVWHGIDHEWGVPFMPREDANQLLEDLAPLAQRVVQGTETHWDGNNHVGHLTDDAQEALDEIDSYLEGMRVDASPWTAEDWYQATPTDELLDVLDITPDMSTEDLQALAEAEVSDAMLDGALLDVDDVRDYLERAA